MSPSARTAEVSERWFVVGTLLLMSDAVFKLLYNRGELEIDSRIDGFPALRLTLTATYAASLLLALARPGALLRLCGRIRLHLLLVALAWASILWSLDPMITFRRCYALTGTTLFALYVSTRFRAGEFLRLLALALGLAAVLSLAAALALPDLGIHHDRNHDGFWRGVYTHKNVLGRVMALGVLVCSQVARMPGARRGQAWLGCALSAALLVLAGSRTAWVVTAALLAVLPLLRLLRQHHTVAAPALVCALALGAASAAWLAGNADAAFGALGRDATLTGRTVLWEEAVQQGLRHPWIGHGYRAFWLGRVGVGSWAPQMGHNDLLDLWLELGLLGVAIYAMTLALCVRGAILAILRRPGPEESCSLLILSYAVLCGISDTNVLQPGNITWIIYIVTAFYLAQSPTPAARQGYRRSPGELLPVRRERWQPCGS